MTNQELEAAVLSIIEKAYEAKYIGKIKIKDILDCSGKIVGYKLILGLNNNERPLTIQIEGTSEQFLKYVEKELRSRHLHYTAFYKGYQVTIDDGCIDTSCSCKK